jgi:hypothetical protein
MSVQSELDRIIGLVNESHEKVKAKGGTNNEPYLLANLPGAIESIPNGVELPSIAEDVLGKASDLAEGKQLIDPDGNIVTGTLIEVPSGSSLFGTHDHVVGGTEGATTFNVKATWDGASLDGVIMRGGTCPGIRDVPTSLLGDAECSDVAKGKTFTSVAGYLARGTREESGITLPEGAIVVQKVIGEQASTQIGSGYSLSVTYGDSVEINDSITLAFTGTTQNLSNISTTTDFSVLSDKYVRAGSSYGTTTGTFYYIPDGATFTVGGQSMNKTLTCDKAQKVTMEKVSL